MMNRIKLSLLYLLFTLAFFSEIFPVIFYSNPEDLSMYVDSGLYPENKFTKKVPLNTNWQFRLEGDDNWKDISIPSAYDNYDSDRKVFFKTNFFLGGKRSSDRSYKLIFYGVNYNANIKVNDVFIENHSGLNSFTVNLDNNHLNFSSTNTLLVEVDNRLSDSTIPAKMQVDGWRNYGGIFRDVYLLITSEIHVSDAEIKYYFNNDYTKASAELTAEIKDNSYIRISDEDSLKHERNIYSYFEIKESASKRQVYKSEKEHLSVRRFDNTTVRFNFEIPDPKLWSPDEPNLYMCSVFIGKESDTAKETDFHRFDMHFGFKDLKMNGNTFMLNGNEIFLKGVSRYEDIKNMGNAVTYSAMKSEIEKIKNTGANILYCKGYPPHPYILDLCDRYGIFVLIEIPVNRAPTSSLRDKNFTDNAMNILTKSLKRDKNHVSLFGVGLGFGYNVYDLHAVDFIKDLSDRSREISDEVLTFITSEYTEYEEYYKVTDFNVITINNYLPESVIEELALNIESKSRTRPIIVNNRLSRVYPKNYGGWSDPYSEPAQAKRLLDTYNLFASGNSISGFIIDSFRDRRSDVTLITNKPGDDHHIIRNGLLNYEGDERLSFRVADAIFKNRAAPALSRGEYKSQEVNIYFIIGIVLTFLYLYMVKREHYLLIHSLRSLKNPDAFFIDIRDRRITQISQALFVGVISAYGISAVMSTLFYSYRQDEKFDYFITYFIRNDVFKKFIAVSSWEPLLFIISSVLFLLTLVLITALVLKFISVFFNTRYSLPIAISMVLWNTIVFLPFVPLSAFFLRVFNPGVARVILFLMFLSMLWFVFRLFLIMAVSYKTTLRRVLWINFLILVSIVFLWAFFFDINFEKITYFFQVMEIL